MSCYSHNDFFVLYKRTGSAAKGEWTEGSKAGENAHFNPTQSGHQKFSFFIIFKQTFDSYKKINALESLSILFEMGILPRRMVVSKLL